MLFVQVENFLQRGHRKSLTRNSVGSQIVYVAARSESGAASLIHREPLEQRSLLAIGCRLPAYPTDSSAPSGCQIRRALIRAENLMMLVIFHRQLNQQTEPEAEQQKSRTVMQQTNRRLAVELRVQSTIISASTVVVVVVVAASRGAREFSLAHTQLRLCALPMTTTGTKSSFALSSRSPASRSLKTQQVSAPPSSAANHSAALLHLSGRDEGRDCCVRAACCAANNKRQDRRAPHHSRPLLREADVRAASEKRKIIDVDISRLWPEENLSPRPTKRREERREKSEKRNEKSAAETATATPTERLVMQTNCSARRS